MVIWFAAFVPSVINSFSGVRAIERPIIEAARMLGTPRWRFVIEILVPAAAPMIFTGLRLSLQAAWTTLVAAELVGALVGLGLVLNMAQQDIYPGMILVGMLALALQQRLTSRYADRDIYVAGHSLGGAIGALINRWQPINGCYIFGTPRIGNVSRLGRLFEPFAMRRHLDVIPHGPPAAFRYANFKSQIAPDGQPFTEADGLELYF